MADFDIWGYSVCEDAVRAADRIIELNKSIHKLQRKIIASQDPMHPVYTKEMDAAMTKLRQELQFAHEEAAKFQSIFPIQTKDLAAIGFQEKMKFLHQVILHVGGFFGSNDLWIFTISDDMVTKEYRQLYSDSLQPDYQSGMPGIEPSFRYKPSTFKNKLLEIHMEEWKHHYDNLGVLDGTQWSLLLRFSTGGVYEFDGSNAYPYNFGKLLKVLGITREFYGE